MKVVEITGKWMEEGTEEKFQAWRKKQRSGEDDLLHYLRFLAGERSR